MKSRDFSPDPRTGVKIALFRLLQKTESLRPVDAREAGEIERGVAARAFGDKRLFREVSKPGR